MVAQKFRFIDLFAGIGGFHLALAGLGGDCVLASEVDDDCQFVYRRAFPQTTLVGDIRTITSNPKSVPDHDVLAAGFPCQPFSKSGAQLGLKDRTRGTLFFEIMEIVRAKRPHFVILENVRNIAGPRHVETWRTVVDSLREEGYGVADQPLVFSPHLLPPALGGAPQIRDRVFILAERDKPSSVECALPYQPVAGWSPQFWSIDDYLDAEGSLANPERYALRPDEVRWLTAWQEFIERVGSDALPGFPIWVDAFREEPTIEADTPLWKANFLFKNSRLYVAHKSWIDGWISRHEVAAFPKSRRKFEWQARGMPANVWDLVIHLRPSGIRVKAPTYLPALVAITQTSIIGRRRRRITPREAARLQSFPDDFQLHPSEGVSYKQLGNAVNVGVVQYLSSILMSNVVSRESQLYLVS